MPLRLLSEYVRPEVLREADAQDLVNNTYVSYTLLLRSLVYFFNTTMFSCFGIAVTYTQFHIHMIQCNQDYHHYECDF